MVFKLVKICQKNVVQVIIVSIIIIGVFRGCINKVNDGSSLYIMQVQNSLKNNVKQDVSQKIEQEMTKQPFDAMLTTKQIDKICMTSLAEVNGNPISNYIKVSSNPSAKKYTYQSKETLYKYSCGFTGKDTFYINGEGWEDIIPRGTLYKGKTSNCVEFDLYDPGFRLTHNFTVCD